MVAPTGWVRLPEDLLDRSGIGSRARPELAGSAISLTSAGARRARSRGTAAEEPAAAASAGPAAELRRVGRRFAAGGGQGAERGLPDRSPDRHHGPVGVGEDDRPSPAGGLDLPTEGEVITLGHRLSGLSRAERAALRRARLP